MRVIARRERAHPGGRNCCRLTVHKGWRITCFATITPESAGWPIWRSVKGQ